MGIGDSREWVNALRFWVLIEDPGGCPVTQAYYDALVAATTARLASGCPSVATADWEAQLDASDALRISEWYSYFVALWLSSGPPDSAATGTASPGNPGPNTPPATGWGSAEVDGVGWGSAAFDPASVLDSHLPWQPPLPWGGWGVAVAAPPSPNWVEPTPSLPPLRRSPLSHLRPLP